MIGIDHGPESVSIRHTADLRFCPARNWTGDSSRGTAGALSATEPPGPPRAETCWSRGLHYAPAWALALLNVVVLAPKSPETPAAGRRPVEGATFGWLTRRYSPGGSSTGTDQLVNGCGDEAQNIRQEPSCLSPQRGRTRPGLGMVYRSSERRFDRLASSADPSVLWGLVFEPESPPIMVRDS